MFSASKFRIAVAEFNEVVMNARTIIQKKINCKGRATVVP